MLLAQFSVTKRCSPSIQARLEVRASSIREAYFSHAEKRHKSHQDEKSRMTPSFPHQYRID